MPTLNAPTPAEVVALINADPARGGRIGAIDEAWIIAENAVNGGISSTTTIETEKCRATLTLAGLDYTALTAAQYGAAFNALRYAIIYQLAVKDYGIRNTQAQKNETIEEFEERLKVWKSLICRAYNDLGVFSEEYCSIGFEKVSIKILTAEDF